MKPISLLLFLVFLFISCNDCENGNGAGENDLIYFSAKGSNSENFTGFLFNPNSQFIDAILENGKIVGLADGRVLFIRYSDSSASLLIFDESDFTEKLVFEEIANINIAGVASDVNFDKIIFFGDSSTVYQTDFLGNLKVISRDAIGNYQIDVSSEGNSAIIENRNGKKFFSIIDANGDVLNSNEIALQTFDLNNRITWDLEERNLIYSLKSGDNSTVFRTRIDGVSQKIFDILGQRVTKPFFVNENTIGYFNFDENRIEARNINGDLIGSIFAASANEEIADFSYSHKQKRLILSIKPRSEEYFDIYYLEFEINDGAIVTESPKLLVNQGFKAFSR